MVAATIKKHEEVYDSIIKFYDLAEEIIDTVEKKDKANQVEYLDKVEPLIENVENATDTLAEEYRNFARTGKQPSIFGRKRIEKSLKRLHDVILEYNNLKKA